MANIEEIEDMAEKEDSMDADGDDSGYSSVSCDISKDFPDTSFKLSSAYYEGKQCYICSKIVCNPQRLRNHFSVKHNSTSAFKCIEDECGKSFEYFKHFKKHIRCHDLTFTPKRDVFHCKNCPETFSTVRTFEAHQKICSETRDSIAYKDLEETGFDSDEKLEEDNFKICSDTNVSTSYEELEESEIEEAAQSHCSVMVKKLNIYELCFLTNKNSTLNDADENTEYFNDNQSCQVSSMQAISSKSSKSKRSRTTYFRDERSEELSANFHSLRARRMSSGVEYRNLRKVEGFGKKIRYDYIEKCPQKQPICNFSTKARVEEASEKHKAHVFERFDYNKGVSTNVLSMNDRDSQKSPVCKDYPSPSNIGADSTNNTTNLTPRKRRIGQTSIDSLNNSRIDPNDMKMRLERASTQTKADAVVIDIDSTTQSTKTPEITQDSSTKFKKLRSRRMSTYFKIRKSGKDSSTKFKEKNVLKFQKTNTFEKFSHIEKSPNISEITKDKKAVSAAEFQKVRKRRMSAPASFKISPTQTIGNAKSSIGVYQQKSANLNSKEYESSASGNLNETSVTKLNLDEEKKGETLAQHQKSQNAANTVVSPSKIEDNQESKPKLSLLRKFKSFIFG